MEDILETLGNILDPSNDQVNHQPEVCILCGRPDMDKSNDHLRHVYKIRQDVLSKDQYCPVLYFDELQKLQLGDNAVCTNRVKCRQAQANNKKR